MDKEQKKKVAAGVAIIGVGGLAAYLLARKREEEPPPPGEDYGKIRGRVLNSESGAIVANAEIVADGAYPTYSDQSGRYDTAWLQYGLHTLTVKASNYETAIFSDILLDSSDLGLDLPLQPIGAQPDGDWTEGIEVWRLLVEPTVASLGETVDIQCSLNYDPSQLPETVVGTVTVNGQTLRQEIPREDIRPAMHFQYHTTQVGEFTARAQDKSANFTVIPNAVLPHYMPWGGVRMPLCTKILVPDVEPFEEHPGGDLLMSGLSYFRTRTRQIIAKLPDAVPVEWEPVGAVVTNWATYFQSAYTSSLLVMATEYTCQGYWDSKDELANIIADSLGEGTYPIPDEWRIQYGSTCPACGGTGIITDHRTRRCAECDGSGISLRVNLRMGWRDWVKVLRYFSICGGGMCTPRLYCPICDLRFDGPPHTQALAWDKVSFVRMFLAHIETAHPNHPLTSPAWF